jgi:hypothetical protein
MSDVDDVFLPKPNDLLVNLTECRAAVESLLGRVNDMFADNHAIGSALGPALQCGFKLIVRSLASTKESVDSFIPVIRVLLAVNSSFYPPVYRALELVLSRTERIQKYWVRPRSVHVCFLKVVTHIRTRNPVCCKQLHRFTSRSPSSARVPRFRSICSCSVRPTKTSPP